MSKRPSLSLAALCLATFLLGACQDASMPAAPAAAAPATAARGPHLTLATSSVTLAVLNPNVDNVYVSTEGHRITIPAGAVCNPLTSGYGAGKWDLPCQPATSPIVFTITSTRDAQGRPRIDVFPDVRFSPSKTVYATFKDAASANAFNSLIAYCPTGSTTCIDESKTDPSLKTVKDKATGQLYRRIKHFSGYNIILGISCIASDDDPDCIDNGNGT